MSWEPNAVALDQVISLFKQADSRDNAVQKQVAEGLHQLHQHPEACNYLAHVFAVRTDLPTELRQRAGLQLKNVLSERFYQHTADNLLYVKSKIPATVSDANRIIRNTAGTIITVFVTRGGIETWPEVLETLIKAIDNPSEDIVDGAFSALSKICEDETEAYKHTVPGPFLDFCKGILIPKLLTLCSPEHLAVHGGPLSRQLIIKKYCLQCLNFFALGGAFNGSDGYNEAEPLHMFLMPYWQTLGVLATDPSPDIRRPVCTGMVTMASSNMEATVLAAAEPVLNFMVQCSMLDDSRVRMEALDFWPIALRSDHLAQIIHKILDKVLPVLFQNTVYSEWDFLGMDQSQLEDDNAAQPDQVSDMKPAFHKAHHAHGEDDEDEDDEKEASTWGGGWTVRKSAALALDHMANRYRNDILPTLLPMVESRLQHQQWEVRESAVLVLGAIAPGCMDALQPFLPKVLEYLLRTCADSKPLLRSISCWCLSRYSHWICSSPQCDVYLKPTLAEILKRILDRNKRVQEAACSAFATFEEAATTLLVPFMGEIVDAMTEAFKYYQAKNLIILYDAVGTFSEAVGSHLAQERYLQVLMPVLQHKWQTVPDNDYSVVALFECWICLCRALGEAFLPYVEIVVARCVRVIRQVLHDIEMYNTKQMTERPNREPMECALDMISALVENLKEKAVHLIGNPNYNFVPYVEQCSFDTSIQIKQSAFALIGDCAKYCPEALRPSLVKLLPELSQHLTHSSTSLCNNASWAIGEIALKMGSQVIEPYADHMVSQIVKTLGKRHLHRSLLQNACITLGRIALVCPGRVAPRLAELLVPYCLVMRDARLDHEKVNAYQGLCAMIEGNPGALVPEAFPVFAESICSFPPPAPPQLHEKFNAIVTGYRKQYGPRWAEVWAKMPLPLQERLQMVYKLD